jgi:hypothetical protein
VAPWWWACVVFNVCLLWALAGIRLAGDERWFTYRKACVWLPRKLKQLSLCHSQRQKNTVAEMTNPARLILLRHGETDWNVSHRLQGQWTADPAPALTETGCTQARYLAKHLLVAYPNVAAIISSDLQRAAQVLPSNAFTTIHPFAFSNISSL